MKRNPNPFFGKRNAGINPVRGIPRGTGTGGKNFGGNAAEKKGFISESLRNLSLSARAKAVKEFGNPIRRAGQLEARLVLAMKERNFEEAKKILEEIEENAQVLQAHANALGKNSYSAMALERQLRILREYEQKLNGK